MAYLVDNAVIMAAGTSSRFAPLSHERPKALIGVKGEILIERQIRQLQEAGIRDIIIVAGYKKEQFRYLEEKLGVRIVDNDDYLTRNNNSSIYAVKDLLRNTYICSADNYFSRNPFEKEVDDAYYSAVFARGETKEWCMLEDSEGYINHVQVGGRDSWCMLGHAFWNEAFSREFVKILEEVYDRPETKGLFWESIYIQHLDTLKMKLRRYPDGVIFEFDSLDELREFDSSYIGDTRSQILKAAARTIGCTEADITEITAYKTQDNAAAGVRFLAAGRVYEYEYKTETLRMIANG